MKLPENYTAAAPGKPSTIGVLLNTRTFFAGPVPVARIEKVNVKKGVSISWTKYGVVKAWLIAKRLAGWEIFDEQTMAPDSSESD